MLESISNLVECTSRSELVGAMESALTNSNRIQELEHLDRKMEGQRKALAEELQAKEAQV